MQIFLWLSFSLTPAEFEHKLCQVETEPTLVNQAGDDSLQSAKNKVDSDPTRINELNSNAQKNSHQVGLINLNELNLNLVQFKPNKPIQGPIQIPEKKNSY